MAPYYQKVDDLDNDQKIDEQKNGTFTYLWCPRTFALFAPPLLSMHSCRRNDGKIGIKYTKYEIVYKH